MPEQRATNVYVRSLDGKLRQAEILSGLVEGRILFRSLTTPINAVAESATHPYVIVLTQDCDLAQDFKVRAENSGQDKLLPNILFCEVHEAAQLRGRTDINTGIWRRIRDNKDERYHFLQHVVAEEDSLGIGTPELGIDFKRYFTMPTQEVYSQLGVSAMRRCQLTSPYLEHLSTRFCYYQFRVALPADHFSEPQVQP